MNLIWTMGDGGAQQIVLNYLQAFQNDPDIDFRVYVFTGPTNSKYDREIKEKNYNVVYLNYPKTKIQIPYIRRWFQSAIDKKCWEEAIAQFQPDIVHVHVSDLLDATVPGIVKANVPVRFDTLHSSPYRYTGRMRSVISDSFRKHGVIPVCLTQAQVKEAKEWYGIQDYVLVRNGLDVDAIREKCCSKEIAREHFGLPADAFVILGVGRLDPIKNFSLLIQAFAEIRKEKPNVLLVFAGEGKEKEKLSRLAESLNLTQHVRFLGNIPDVTKLYCAADVLAVPSISESLSLVALEAQFCGLRCVISDGVPWESILLEQTKKMPPDASAAQWAKALMDTQYHESPAFASEPYHLQATIQQMKKIYLERYTQAMANRSNAH